jgi:hypothetical protein
MTNHLVHLNLKLCSSCKSYKELSEFGPNKRHKDGLQRYCRECGRAHQRAHYRKTPEKNPARLANRQRTYARNAQFLWDFLLEHPCVDCGERDPIVLEFDHVRGEKEFSVAQSVRLGLSLDSIIEEIAKCEVRCANCHRRKTAERGQWYKTVNRNGSYPPIVIPDGILDMEDVA